jgi:hypothetical protein
MRTIANLIILISLSYQWSCPAHTIVAAVAFNELGMDYVLNKIKPLMDNAKENYTKYNIIYEYACWADDIKNSATSPWHFYDLPFFDGYTCNVTLPATGNVAYLVNLAKKTLKGEDTSHPKSSMMRYLIHMMGDIHQPLHVTNRYSPDFPNGDEGGNDFNLAHSDELHALWDRVLDYVPKYNRPLSITNKEFTESFAAAITQEYPRSYFANELREKDGFAIANEVHPYAENHAYKNIAVKDTPTDAYKIDGYTVCKRLLALAGYRLADAIRDSYVGTESSGDIN